MKAMLVRRRDIEREEPPAGAFRTVRLGGGWLPSRALRPAGTFCVDTTDRVFSLTYDDGPDPLSTPGVLDVLARHGVAATFFVLAEAVRRHPEIVRRIVADGHEVALHGMNHRSLLTMPLPVVEEQLREARDVVAVIAGRPVTLYRPPYGSHNLRQARLISRLGLDLTIWSGAAGDWIDDAEENVAARAVASVFPGAILLLHDTRADPETLGPGERLPAFDRGAVLERILQATSAAGYTPMTVGALMARYPLVKSLARERMSLE